MLRLCLSGIGKAGSEIARFLLDQEDVQVVSAISSPNSQKCGRDLGDVIGCGTLGINIESSENLEKEIFRTKPDIAIDFSTPAACLKNVFIFSKMNINQVIGTTGFSSIEAKQLEIIAAKFHTGIVYAPNITQGVNVMMLLTNIATRILNQYDFHIVEVHHKKKKDIPSGTALRIAEGIGEGLRESGNYKDCDIPITSVRAGNIVGMHKVMILSDYDKIEITHESTSRNAFAAGALQASRFIAGKTGFYSMEDVLNLNEIVSDYLFHDKKLQLLSN